MELVKTQAKEIYTKTKLGCDYTLISMLVVNMPVLIVMLNLFVVENNTENGECGLKPK